MRMCQCHEIKEKQTEFLKDAKEQFTTTSNRGLVKHQSEAFPPLFIGAIFKHW